MRPRIANARSYGEAFSEELRLGVATLRVEPDGPGAHDVRALPSFSNVEDHPTLRLEKLEQRAVSGPSEELDALNGGTTNFLTFLSMSMAPTTAFIVRRRRPLSAR
jgi:hypothetical protein